MGWWAIGEDEYMGDAPASTTSSAFDKLAQSRTDAGKPLLTYDEVTVLLAATVGRSSRELATRKDAKFVALATKPCGSPACDSGIPFIFTGGVDKEIDERQMAQG